MFRKVYIHTIFSVFYKLFLIFYERDKQFYIIKLIFNVILKVYIIHFNYC